MPGSLGYRHIEAIRAVLMAGSVTGAAERLRVTQPAISNTLRDAEDRLGFKLFERRAGALVPNSAASLLLEEIERSFIGLDDINALAERIGRGEGRRLDVSVTPAFAATALPGILASWRARVPGALVTVESRNANLVVAMVASQRADIGFAPEVPALRGVMSEVIAHLPMVCYLPAGHRLGVRGATVHAHELVAEPMISPGNVERIDKLIDRAFQACGRSPVSVMECPALITACSMVAAGIGFTLMTPLPSWLLRRGSVSVHPFEPQIHVTYRAYWTEGRLPEEERELLIERARQELLKVAQAELRAIA